MPLVTSRRSVLPAVALISVLLVAGCHGKATKSSASATPTSTVPATTAAPTSTGPPPLTAKERAWLTAVDTLANKAEKAITGTSEVITRAKLQSHARVLRGYSRKLQQLGLRGGRLQPVSVLLKNAHQQFDKGAACYTTAARIVSPGGAVEAGPNERRFNSALDCATAGEGNGLNDLLEAAAAGKEISPI
jgi:hypothetical protein